jgi:hypothetical protein
MRLPGRMVADVALDPGVGIGVSEPGLPSVVQIALQFRLEPANCVAARGNNNLSPGQGRTIRFKVTARL